MAVSAPSFPPSRYTPPRGPPRCGDAVSKVPCDRSRGVAATATVATSRNPTCDSDSELLPSKRLAAQAESPQAILCAAQDNFSQGTESHALCLHKAKRIRDAHDVDGPGTDKLPIKKRRLLLRLVTSRLSQPFSFPATHILIRESGNGIPVLHRIQQFASFGGGKRRARHQGALVRKAAILNRFRICVRQAAVAWGHELAARSMALANGLQLVTTEMQFPMAASDIRMDLAPITHTVARSHTTSNPSASDCSYTNCNVAVGMVDHLDTQGGDQGTDGPDDNAESTPYIPAKQGDVRPESPHIPSASPAIAGAPPWPPTDTGDEEDDTAFPASSFHDRYAELSEDDMDDVYADFEVLFGSGSFSPEASPGPVEEQLYEEYLDGLDGIPWGM